MLSSRIRFEKYKSWIWLDDNNPRYKSPAESMANNFPSSLRFICRIASNGFQIEMVVMTFHNTILTFSSDIALWKPPLCDGADNINSLWDLFRSSVGERTTSSRDESDWITLTTWPFGLNRIFFHRPSASFPLTLCFFPFLIFLRILIPRDLSSINVLFCEHF